MLTIAKDKFVASILLIVLMMLFFVLPEWQAYFTIGLWLTVVLFCLRHAKERMLLLLFQITLFTFLMTRLVLPDIVSTPYIDGDMNSDIRLFSSDTLHFIYTTLNISIVATFIGFCLIPDVAGKTISHYNTDNAYILSIKRLSKSAYYICSLFYLLLVLEKSIYVFQYGYFELYADFDSKLPGIVHKLADLYLPFFYLFLATFPSKKEARIPILLYASIGVFSLATGSRTTFMLAIIVLLVYFFLRNILSPNDPWISKKGIIVIFILSPLLLIGMFVIAFVRIDVDYDSTSLLDLLINFFYQQGTSVRVIGLTYEMQDMLNDGRLFSFGYYIDNFNKNILFKLLGIAKEYKPQTVEMAMYGHSLANTLTYLDAYESFLEGYGYGTSYIAEVWHDFGYIGLFLWNVMYGIIFAKFYYWIQKGLWQSTFCLLMIPHLIYAPRGQASAFLYFFASITILLSFYIIHSIAKRHAKA